MTKTKLSKGATAEEALKEYFLSLGFYVLRSIKYNFKSYVITDIDLWLYSKNSTMTREIINVDIKKRRTPQAIERIFWTKGLQDVLGSDKCIVATTDKRKDTKEFGDLHNVLVLDGNFLNRLTKLYKNSGDILTEEEFDGVLNEPCLQDGCINWGKVYSEIKQELILNLDFNGANLFLNKAKFAIDDYLSSDMKSQASLRMFLLSLSFFTLSIDYKSRLFAYLEADERKKVFEEGFRYGESGRKRADEIFNTAIELIEKTTDSNLFIRHTLEQEIDHQLNKYPADILSAYFAKSEVLKSLFKLAKSFNKLSYSRNLPPLNQLDSEIKSLLGIFCDFYKIDRKSIL